MFYRTRIEELERKIKELEQKTRQIEFDTKFSAENGAREGVSQWDIGGVTYTYSNYFGYPATESVSIRTVIRQVLDHLNLRVRHHGGKAASVTVEPKPKAKKGK